MAFKGPFQLNQFCDPVIRCSPCRKTPFPVSPSVEEVGSRERSRMLCPGLEPWPSPTQYNTTELSLPSSETDYATIQDFAFPPSYSNTQCPACTQSKQNPSSGPAASFLPTPQEALSFLGLPAQRWPSCWENPTHGGCSKAGWMALCAV